MDLENLENLESYVQEFFEWLFEDSRILDKEVNLESEFDLVLASTRKNENIYFPKQIANFFNTKAMQRLGRISQLGLAVEQYPNAAHTRLEHSKGVYYWKLIEMLHNFQNPEWKRDIETNNMKLYLLAELIKVAGHDIGHMPLSHALEVTLSKRGMHEEIGKKIMLEDPEIQSVLKSISPDLPEILRELYTRPVLNFNQHDESNYDNDRFDYVPRDYFYAETETKFQHPYIHYQKGEYNGKDVDVYSFDSLRKLEDFLLSREFSYESISFHPVTQLKESSIKDFFDAFLSSSLTSGEHLRDLVTYLKETSLEDLDLSKFLEWDDISFYSDILDIASESEEIPKTEDESTTKKHKALRDLATLTIPSVIPFLNMIYSQLDLFSKEKNYSEQDKRFLQKVKSLLIDNPTPLSSNLRSPDFLANNTLIFPNNISGTSEDLEMLRDLHQKGLIHYRKISIRAYDPQTPIYVLGRDNKVYELSEHPDRRCDWQNKIIEIPMAYAYIPYLQFNGIDDNTIDKLRTFCGTNPISNIKNSRYQNYIERHFNGLEL